MAAGAGRPDRRGVSAAVPLGPTLPLARPQRARRPPLRPDRDRAAGARRRAPADGRARRVARRGGDLRRGGADRRVRVAAGELPQDPRATRGRAAGSRRRGHAGVRRSVRRTRGLLRHTRGGEIVVGGRKLVGSAQLRQRTALLQHGSILLEGSQEIIGAISRPPSAVSGGTTLAAVLGRPVSFEEVAEAVVRAWGDAVTATAPDRPLPPCTAFFSDPAWTWRR